MSVESPIPTASYGLPDIYTPVPSSKRPNTSVKKQRTKGGRNKRKRINKSKRTNKRKRTNSRN